MAPSQTNYVEVYWSGVVQRLQAEVQVMNRLVPHHGEQGRANELTLFRLLESLLPSSVSVGSGIIFDSQGNASAQTDLVLFDSSRQPKFLAQTTQFLYPVETVLAAIEVKTTLDDEELSKTAKSKGMLDQLRPANGSTIPPFYLMAYSAGLLPETMAGKVGAVATGNRPDYMCVLSTAVIAGRMTASTEPQEGDGEREYFAGLTALHALNDDGERISNSWQPPVTNDKPPHPTTFLRTGMTYQVTALSQSNRRRLVCEPGRALLLFCERILSDLHARGVAAQPFIGAYLTGLAHETYTLELGN